MSKKQFLLAVILLFFSVFTFAQQGVITGTVKAEDGTPLPGATIQLKGTTTGAVTDLDGNYSLSVSGIEKPILVISYIGYQTQEISATGKTKIEIQLKTNVSTVDEVVVIGYGSQKKSIITGAIAKVSSEDLDKVKDLRIEQSLQGKTAGVVIMNNSGQPGDNMTIRIRGTGTTGNNDPLFVIDGLPTSGGLDYLSSTDIESVEVLKDAASSAIYGSRAANGVILITTKQGKKGGKMVVSYDGSYGIQNPWRKLKMLNSQQYIDIINEAGKNDGRSNPYFPQSMIDTLRWNTDWQDEMYYKNAPKSSHTLAINGGGENTTLSTSLNYYSQDGIIAKGKSDFERVTYRINSTAQYGRLVFGGNATLVDIKKKDIDGNNAYGTGLNQAINMPPIVPVTYDDGSWAVPSDFNVSLQEITNPIALLSIINKKTDINKVVAGVFAELKLIKGMTFRSSYGTEYTYQNITSYTPTYFIDATHKNTGDTNNYAEKETDKWIKWNWDNTLTYNLNLGKHSITAMIGYSKFMETYENLWTQKSNLIFNDLGHAYLDNSLNKTSFTNNGYTEHRLQSYFGRLNYNYAEKYLMEAVVRRDGSSRFGSANLYGLFPSFSVGWIPSKENFFPQNNIVNFAKLRLGWGQNGNEPKDDYKYTSVMSSGLYYFFGDNQQMYSGMQPSFYPNAALRWETSQQANIGMDLRLLSNKLTLTADYYDKRTKDWLVNAPDAMAEIGNVGPVINGGEVKNTGIEFELGYKKTYSNNFQIDLKLTGSHNKSEVLKILSANGSYTGGEGIKGQGDVLRMEEGQPLGYFWGYKTDGVIQNDEELALVKSYQPHAKVGDLRFVDINRSGTLNDSDKVNIGNPYPKIILGLNMGFEWKGIDLYMFWYAALGQQIWMANRRADLIYSNYTTDVLDRWHGEGTSNDVPRVTLSDPNQSWKKASDFYVKDDDYLRLKNITLGYTLPKKIINWAKIDKLRIYLTSENLLTFTKYPGMEVEAGGDPLNIGIDHGVYPASRTFLAGVSVIF